jgi:hypothetical protein
MDQQEKCSVYDGVVVPESPLLRRERTNRYGSVEGLPDEELADPDELERVIYLEEFAPVLQLPVKAGGHRLCGSIDDSGKVDFGAFGTVDFDRLRPEVDKARYKAQKLKERLKDLVIMLTIMNERIPGRAKYQVLKYVRMGLIELGDIVDNEMYFFAELYLVGVRLRKEIARLQKASREKRLEEVKAWVDSAGD